MRLITRFELAHYSKSELQALYREIFNALAATAPDSVERRNCLVSLQNLAAEIASRAPCP